MYEETGLIYTVYYILEMIAETEHTVGSTLRTCIPPPPPLLSALLNRMKAEGYVCNQNNVTIDLIIIK